MDVDELLAEAADLARRPGLAGTASALVEVANALIRQEELNQRTRFNNNIVRFLGDVIQKRW